MNLQINKIQFPVYNLGQGKRIGIWLQGCTLACKGCVNKTLWSPSGGQSITVPDLFNWIIAHAEGFDGITISGGEPFQQYHPLIAFLYLIKTRTSLHVHCFSGYSVEELLSNHPDQLFLHYIDILVDGRYIQSLPDDANWRGSSNQRLFQFRDGKVIPLAEPTWDEGAWSLLLDSSRELYLSGIPKKGQLKTLEKKMAACGCPNKFK